MKNNDARNFQADTRMMAGFSKIRHELKIDTRIIPDDKAISHRPVTAGDAHLLGTLMDRACAGTDDHAGETLEDCIDEMRGTLSGIYGELLDFASFAVDGPGHLRSTSVVTLYRDEPLLVFSMTDPGHQGLGLAGYLIERSISALARQGYDKLHLVVTEGNETAQRLYARLGFA